MKRLLVGLILSFVLAGASSGQTGDGEWFNLAYMPSERQELATAVLRGKIYTIAGYTGTDFDVRSTATVDVYNPATDTWSSAHDLPTLNNHNCAAVVAGKLYAFAGTSPATYLYDPVNDSWSLVGVLNYPHTNTAAVGVINDKIYIAGGLSEGVQAEVFDPATNTWTSIASMHIGRHHCAGGVINGKFYVAAGRGFPQAETALEVYDPQTNSWSTLAPMPTGRSGVAAAVVHDELYVFGGEGSQGVYPHVEVYNPTTNTWRRIQNMPEPRHGIWASVIGSRIFITGGGLAQNFLPSGVNSAFNVTSKATFANISTRLKVGTGDNVLIGGVIVSGTAPKRLIVRALGPSVPLPGTLANPRLELFDAAGQLIAANDNWRDAPNRQEIGDSGLAPVNDLESAILTTVPPGNLTAVVRGAGDSTGTALVEVYDLEGGSASSLANISTRGLVQTNDDILIAGIIFDGQIQRKVIVRAIGPSLPVANALADPRLELRDANGGLVAQNDNWRTDQEAEISMTIPPSNDLESAIIQTLPPARYTGIVRGVNNGTGLAVVEAYALD
ncbi:MAG: trimeric autotransporter adhesin [Verrucomicrobiota bacterium]